MPFGFLQPIALADESLKFITIHVGAWRAMPGDTGNAKLCILLHRMQSVGNVIALVWLTEVMYEKT